jgi:hypothetical protein
LFNAARADYKDGWIIDKVIWVTLNFLFIKVEVYTQVAAFINHSCKNIATTHV